MRSWCAFAVVLILAKAAPCFGQLAGLVKTEVSIVGDAFHINGQPTYPGRIWKGKKIEGLLFKSECASQLLDQQSAQESLFKLLAEITGAEPTR